MGQETGKRKRTVWWLVVLVGLPLAFYVLTIDSGRSIISSRARSSLQQINLAMLMYQEDNDGRFPLEMSTNDHLREALMVYLKIEEIFDTLNPDESEFVGNGLLAGRRVAGLYGQETTISVYDSKIWKGMGLRNVGFVDGHVKFVDEDAFLMGLIVEYLYADPE